MAEQASGGRHRRGRASSGTEQATSVAEVEPLFTHEMLYPDDEDLLVDLTGSDPWLAPTPTAGQRWMAPSVDPTRPGMIRSFRSWWRQESLARSAQKRAFATAEAIVRAQAVQHANQPFEPTTTPQSHTQAVRSVMALTEERFQSLGVRSDRLHDELVAVSRGVNELRREMARLTGALHEVITEISGFTSASSVEGERAEPR